MPAGDRQTGQMPLHHKTTVPISLINTGKCMPTRDVDDSYWNFLQQQQAEDEGESDHNSKSTTALVSSTSVSKSRMSVTGHTISARIKIFFRKEKCLMDKWEGRLIIPHRDYFRCISIC